LAQLNISKREPIITDIYSTTSAGDNNQYEEVASVDKLKLFMEQKLEELVLFR